jgi:uncharacterized protein
MMIARFLEKTVKEKLFSGKTIIVLGPRQSGKTTLLHKVCSEAGIPFKWFNGDEADVRLLLSNTTSTRLKSLIGNHRLVIIDEAQRIENIGLTLKLIHDNFREIQLIASGSSSFELANQINEPLTGRKWQYFLFPLSVAEIANQSGWLEEERLLEDRLIFGCYPEIVSHPTDRNSLLHQLSDSYLYKDILTWEYIKKPAKLENLLRALAFQIGSEVSYNELGITCGLDSQTVERYIDLLEKSFIVFRLPALSRNLRNEIRRSRKIYFFDLGIRNSIINNFNPLQMRNDIGGLWENFLVAERLKFIHYNHIYVNRYFWRTHQQQEIDYIEERDGILHAFEFKWSGKKTKKIPASFKNAYPDSDYEVITRESYAQFLGLTEL